MKKSLLFTIAALFLAAVPAFSQFSFGVGPGINLNTAYFGYKFGKAVPYIGIQYCGISGSISRSVNYLNPGPTDESFEDKFTGKVIMPSLGLKYFVMEKNKVKGYVNATLAKPFLSAKVTVDGHEITEVSDEVKNVSMWGGSLGVGAEYFFDDNFSVGGEFGIHALTAKYSKTTTESDYNGNGEADVKNEVKAMVMPTYSKITLNFYF